MKRAGWGYCVFLYMLLDAVNVASFPPVSIEKINHIPDLCQSDPRAAFPDGGKEYCCIVAISNSLMWLGENGYRDLINPQDDSFMTQVLLAEKLASSDYMNTDPERGTGTPNIMRGLNKYITDHGYTMDRFEYRGWRPHPVEMASQSLYPSLDWIKEGFQGRGAVWLNIGWYTYDASNDTYERISGHWVTVVGYGESESGQEDSDVLIFHDPSSRTGTSLAHEYVQMQEIQTGILTGSYSGLPRSAKGFFKTVSGMHVKPPAECGIIDGALLMVPDMPGSMKRLTIESHEVSDRLNEARLYLTGTDKNLEEAKLILRSILTSPSANPTPEERCYILVYLGYIEDLQGKRNAAKSLFQKASKVQGTGFDGIKDVGISGIRKPITSIRHLDNSNANETKSSSESKTTAIYGDIQIIDQIGSALIFDNPPIEKSPLKNINQKQRQEIFEDLVRSIDRYFSFFEHKKIDWDLITSEYRERLNTIQTTQHFYELIYELIRELQDAHSWLKGYETSSELDSFAPQISFRQIEGKPVAVYVPVDSKAWQRGIRPGYTLTSINDSTVEHHMNFLQEHIRVSSSERHLREVLTRRILCGPENSSVKTDFLSLNGESLIGIQLSRDRTYLQRMPDPSFTLKTLQYIDYGSHPSGYGYIKIKSFKGRMEIADEFDQAIEQLRQTEGLIIDIRENPGGYGTCQNRIIGRFLTAQAKGIISYKRDGPKHNDFKVAQQTLYPSGEWQYTNPVGLLMNPITGSASDLFAARLISTGRCITLGRTTHGNLTGDAVYVWLPCDLFVRISTGYITDASGRIIEGNGNEPEIIIEPTLEDAKQQVDGVLERAFIELGTRVK